jgi:hypothetical protein
MRVRAAVSAGWGLALALLAGGPALAQPAPAPVPLGAEAAGEQTSAEARALARWIVESDDSHGRPFVIVDKTAARVFAYHADGRVAGQAPALLGRARGDDSVPGIGRMRLADIAPSQRVTPAGRFEAHLGTNLGGSDILWLDYEDALSLHRVATANRAEQRLQRLATASVIDNRISYGCINVPAAFYEGVILPLFRPVDGVVYVLPETRALSTVFAIGGAPGPGGAPVR